MRVRASSGHADDDADPQQIPSFSAGTDSPKRCKRNAAMQNIIKREYPVKRNVLFISLTWSNQFKGNDKVYT